VTSWRGHSVCAGALRLWISGRNRRIPRGSARVARLTNRKRFPPLAARDGREHTHLAPPANSPEGSSPFAGVRPYGVVWGRPAATESLTFAVKGGLPGTVGPADEPRPAGREPADRPARPVPRSWGRAGGVFRSLAAPSPRRAPFPPSQSRVLQSVGTGSRKGPALDRPTQSERSRRA